MELFDWQMVLTNDLPYIFLVVVIFRVFIMFLLLLVFLRLTGKNGVRHFSIFEMVFIIVLGSAVGDLMLYDNAGLLPKLTVLVVTIILYKILTIISAKFKIVEYFLEGKTTCIIDDGEFLTTNLKKEHMARDEFFFRTEIKIFRKSGSGLVSIM